MGLRTKIKKLARKISGKNPVHDSHNAQKMQQAQENKNANFTSLTDITTDYPSFCAKAASDENIFNTFRTNPAYTRVLEHVSYKDGARYLDVIKQRKMFSASDFKEFAKNDYYGGAVTYFYEGAGQFSPTTLRYIKVLSDLILEFGDLSALRICEIGVGYGGQARLILSSFDVKSYQLLDLDSVLALDKRYLGHFGDIESKIIYGLQEQNICDLLISNYAFSELRTSVQDMYVKRLGCIPHGYITFNNIAESGFNHTLSEYPKLFNADIKIKDEIPQTHENNRILVW